MHLNRLKAYSNMDIRGLVMDSTMNFRKNLKFWKHFVDSFTVVPITEPFGHQLRMNMGVMIPINSDNFYFETKQEKIQMKKIFFVLFIIVILMISFLVYDNRIRQLDLKNHKTISLMNQILEFR